MQYLEAHYDERNAIDFCGKLTSMSQTTEETPYSFIMCCIEILQKVFMVSKSLLSNMIIILFKNCITLLLREASVVSS